MAETKKRQINDVFEKVQQDKIDIEQLPKKIITPKSVTYNKRTHTIQILKDFNLEGNSQTITISHIINNFPSWALSFTHVTTIYSSTNAHTFDPNNFEYSDQTRGIYMWRQVDGDEGSYELLVNIRRPLRKRQGNQFIDVPTFVDLSITILNEKIWDEIQHKKT